MAPYVRRQYGDELYDVMREIKRLFDPVGMLNPGVVMDEMGHTDPGLALRVYRQTMRREDDERARLQALVEGVETAVIGSRRLEVADRVEDRRAA